MFAGAVVAVIAVFAVAIVHVGLDGLVQKPAGAGSPFDLIPYGQLLGLLLVPALFATTVFIAAGATYWRQIGPAPDRLSWSALAKAVGYAMTLRYLRGGGQECYYPEDTVPSPARRRLRTRWSRYGFEALACFRRSRFPRFCRTSLVKSRRIRCSRCR